MGLGTLDLCTVAPHLRINCRLGLLTGEDIVVERSQEGVGEGQEHAHSLLVSGVGRVFTRRDVFREACQKEKSNSISALEERPTEGERGHSRVEAMNRTFMISGDAMAKFQRYASSPCDGWAGRNVQGTYSQRIHLETRVIYGLAVIQEENGTLWCTHHVVCSQAKLGCLL